MNETSGDGTAFRSSVGLAFIGGYADASGYLLARTFTGHLTGNCVLAAVSAAGKDWYLTFTRLMAVIAFLGGLFYSLILDRFLPVRLRQYSLVIAMLTEVLLFLSASLLLSNRATQELFILCMCFALGVQNGALHKTNGISVHSTYMTGMVTTLMQKGFNYYSSKQSHKEESAKDSTRLSIQVLAPMWISFISGALTGAVIVSSFRSIGLWAVVLLLILLTLLELKQTRQTMLL
ncbi:MAG: DUF1275 domain-containing protein [Verrucomicrobia bacterium]|nr:DUF1275 domain-containing protein [Verrucomicrobiota bacterium]